jgi:4'-phosphopantetheinyl transferase
MIELDQIWLRPPAVLALAPGEVHVWRACVCLPAASVKELQRTLAADELDRARRYRFLKDRQRFIVARGVLRSILGRYLQLEPGRICFCYSAYGKPALDSSAGQPSQLSFNVAHSGDLALYALTLRQRVGVDLERVRLDLDYEQVAEQFFSPHERSALRTLPAQHRHEAFFSCWTRKEAYIKARGAGLSMPLEQFTVSLTPGEPARLLDVAGDPHEGARWSLWGLEPGPGYAGALAVEGAVQPLHYWHWPE